MTLAIRFVSTSHNGLPSGSIVLVMAMVALPCELFLLIAYMYLGLSMENWLLRFDCEVKSVPLPETLTNYLSRTPLGCLTCSVKGVDVLPHLRLTVKVEVDDVLRQAGELS